MKKCFKRSAKQCPGHHQHGLANDYGYYFLRSDEAQVEDYIISVQKIAVKDPECFLMYLFF